MYTIGVSAKGLSTAVQAMYGRTEPVCTHVFGLPHFAEPGFRVLGLKCLFLVARAKSPVNSLEF